MESHTIDAWRVSPDAHPTIFLANRSHTRGSIEARDPVQDTRVIERIRCFPVGFFDEQMEVVAHDAMGAPAHAVKGHEFAHLHHEVFL